MKKVVASLKKNVTTLPEFVKLCKMTQTELKHFLFEELKKEGYEPISADGFLYAKGEVPVLLTAHMDTVHKEPVKDFYEYDGKLSSPQGIGGDDRCGIYMILQIIKEIKCSVLFCEDEEIGSVGSDKFCRHKDLIEELSKLNYMIELDRRGENDAVFYDCDNEEFTDFILNNTGCVEKTGSFSDISVLAPEVGIAAVNLSCGYYNEHALKEYVVLNKMLNMIETVKELIKADGQKQFEYIKSEYGGLFRCRSGYCEITELLYVVYVNEEEVYVEDYVEGKTREECWKNFFFQNPDVCFNQVEDYFYDYYY